MRFKRTSGERVADNGHYIDGREERELEQLLLLIVARMDIEDARAEERRFIANGVGYYRVEHADGTFSVRRIESESNHA